MASEQEIIAAQAAEIERLRNKVASLEDQLYWLRKKMFGKMSEKNLPLDPTVLSEPGLFDEPLTDEERAELDAAVRKEEEQTTKLIQVKGFERKPRKAIDTANLEVREEHIYPEVENVKTIPNLPRKYPIRWFWFPHRSMCAVLSATNWFSSQTFR